MRSELSTILSQCQDLVLDGKEYIDIRQFIEEQKLSDDEQKMLLYEVDGLLVGVEHVKQVRNEGIMQMLMGGLVLIIGIVISFLSLSNNSSKKYILIGLVGFGLATISYGYKNYNCQLEDIDKGDRKFKKGKFGRF